MLLYPSPYHYINGGNPYGPSHLAIDLYAPEGTPISAADSGVVVWSSYGEWNGGYGSVVMIDHRNGFSTLYGHLSAIAVQVGQIVAKGERLGAAGAPEPGVGVRTPRVQGNDPRTSSMYV